MVTGTGVRVEVKAIGAEQVMELKASNVIKMGCPHTHTEFAQEDVKTWSDEEN